jgi:TRAP-type C4-dicarboxylate transport system permease small subunit
MQALQYTVNNFEKMVSVVLMSTMTAIMILQVFMRYVLGNSLSWSEEAARYLFIWLIYIAISFGAQEMKHIKIDAALLLFPKRWRPKVLILGDILFLVFCFYICWTAWGIVGRQIRLGQTSPALHVPMWSLYSAPLVGFGLTAIRQVQTIRHRLAHPELDV